MDDKNLALAYGLKRRNSKRASSAKMAAPSVDPSCTACASGAACMAHGGDVLPSTPTDAKGRPAMLDTMGAKQIKRQSRMMADGGDVDIDDGTPVSPSGGNSAPPHSKGPSLGMLLMKNGGSVKDQMDGSKTEADRLAEDPKRRSDLAEVSSRNSISETLNDPTVVKKQDKYGGYANGGDVVGGGIAPFTAPTLADPSPTGTVSVASPGIGSSSFTIKHNKKDGTKKTDPNGTPDEPADDADADAGSSKADDAPAAASESLGGMFAEGGIVDAIMKDRSGRSEKPDLEDDMDMEDGRDAEAALAPKMDYSAYQYMGDEEHDQNIDKDDSEDTEGLVGQILKERRMRRQGR